MIKKHKTLLIAFFCVHLVASILLFFPLGMNFGHSDFAELLLILTRFPIDYKSVVISLFWFPLLINSLFWTFIFLSFVYLFNLMKKRFVTMYKKT